MKEPRYTLWEARQIFRKQECALYGHKWDPMVAMCNDVPTGFVCTNCGRIVNVEKESK